jgi:hypothetical protein
MTRDRLGFRRQTETAMEPAFAELKSIRSGKKKQAQSSALLCEWRSLLFSFSLLYTIAFDLRIWILVPSFLSFTHIARNYDHSTLPFLFFLSLFV